jgi:hypothetical protein
MMKITISRSGWRIATSPDPKLFGRLDQLDVRGTPGERAHDGRRDAARRLKGGWERAQG